MKKHKHLFLAGAALLALSLTASAADIELVPPDTKGGKPLMQCLAERSSNRTFSGKMLTDQQLSDLFYAANGVNRSEAEGRLTNPTARNAQDMEIYAAMASGLYRYDNKNHKLVQLSDQDIRKECGRQVKMMESAPIVLIYVSDQDKLKSAPDMKNFYSANHAGYISQNVYLFAAANDLNTVVVGLTDKDNLKKVLKLDTNSFPQMVQPIGSGE